MSEYRPGRDHPPADSAVAGSEAASGAFHASRGAGGVFAKDIQGATLKYSHNRGDGRQDYFRDTLCRFFVRVDEADRDLFRRSIADPVIARDAIMNAVSGDPRGNRGYVDFLMLQANLGFQELIQVGQVLSGNHLVYTFDQQPPTMSFQGMALNTVQDDQFTHLLRLYLNVMRATALARRQKAMSIKIDALVLTGVWTAFSPSFESKFEQGIAFSGSFQIKRLAITEYTSGWRPTSVSSPFATDLNAVPSDTRVFTERPVNAVTTRRPADLVEEVERGETDARVAQANPQPAADPRPSDLAVAQAALTNAAAANTRAAEQLEQARADRIRVQARLTATQREIARLRRVDTPTQAILRSEREDQAALARHITDTMRLEAEVRTTRDATTAAAQRVNYVQSLAPAPATTPAPAAPAAPAVLATPTPETHP